MIHCRYIFYKCMRLRLDLPPASHLDAAHSRKINWVPLFNEENFALQLYSLNIVPSYINHMFKPSCKRYNTKLPAGLDMPFRKTNTGQQTLSFLRPKIWTKISHITKKVEKTASLTGVLKIEVLNK